MSNLQRINIEQAHTLISEQAPVIVDVRDANAFQAAALDGAVNLNNDTVKAFLENTARDQPILVYCYHGNSSLNAAQFLADQGFEQVMSMEGGFEAWRQRYPVD
jgi:thiosulfate sulfurtransferase